MGHHSVQLLLIHRWLDRNYIRNAPAVEHNVFSPYSGTWWTRTDVALNWRESEVKDYFPFFFFHLLYYVKKLIINNLKWPSIIGIIQSTDWLIDDWAIKWDAYKKGDPPKWGNFKEFQSSKGITTCITGQLKHSIYMNIPYNSVNKSICHIWYHQLLIALFLRQLKSTVNTDT